jgi:predicted HAD superfamily Cof-like phosphohydrolase
VNLFYRVLTFMVRFGQVEAYPLTSPPHAPADDVVRKRCLWLIEEALELLEACFPGERAIAEIAGCRRSLRELIEGEPVRVDLVAYADANADIRYVAYGNDVAACIDSRDIDAEVCRSNDTKQPPKESGGKVEKGPNYSPPAIAAILREQGWRQS